LARRVDRRVDRYDSKRSQEYHTQQVMGAAVGSSRNVLTGIAEKASRLCIPEIRFSRNIVPVLNLPRFRNKHHE
jgi:hypothetical protein